MLTVHVLVVETAAGELIACVCDLFVPAKAVVEVFSAAHRFGCYGEGSVHGLGAVCSLCL